MLIIGHPTLVRWSGNVRTFTMHACAGCTFECTFVWKMCALSRCTLVLAAHLCGKCAQLLRCTLVLAAPTPAGAPLDPSPPPHTHTQSHTRTRARAHTHTTQGMCGLIAVICLALSMSLPTCMHAHSHSFDVVPIPYMVRYPTLSTGLGCWTKASQHLRPCSPSTRQGNKNVQYIQYTNVNI